MKAYKKYDEGGQLDLIKQGGAGADILTGGVQAVQGVMNLRRANQALAAAQASAPSLETPAQYYENYRNAYDSQLARLESDALQSNLASSVQALQGAGGRALVGGLSSSVAATQLSQNRMLAQERQARMAAGQQLAKAEENAIDRKEKRNQIQQAQAQAAANAARQNIVSGLSNVATGVMFGGIPQIGAGLKKGFESAKDGVAKAQKFFHDRQVDKTTRAIGAGKYSDFGKMEAFTQNMFGDFKTMQDAKSSWDSYLAEKGVGIAAQPLVDKNKAGLSASLDRMAELDKQRQSILDAQQAQFIQDQTSQALAVGDRTTQASGVGGASTFGGSSELGAFGAIVGDMATGSGTVADEGTSSRTINARLLQIQEDNKRKKELEKEGGFTDPATGQFIPYQSGTGITNLPQSIPGTYKSGGMMTKGKFDHKTNPIDIVQNGQKVGEATGNEYILNPKQAAAIAKESSYARKLFKRFERNAKKK